MSGLFLSDLPAVSLHVVEVDLPAGVTHIAPDGVGIQEALMYLNVLKGDIPHSHSRLGRTGALLVEGVQHAPRAVPVRLLHLLRTNVNSPPDRPVHRKITVVNILNEPSPLVPRVSLDVDALKWPDHPDIAESDIPDAVTT